MGAFQVEGEVSLTLEGSAQDIGVDAAAVLLDPVLRGCRARMPSECMAALCNGLLAGVLDHFSEDLPREKLLELLGLAKDLVEGCDAFKPAADMPARVGKAVH